MLLKSTVNLMFVNQSWAHSIIRTTKKLKVKWKHYDVTLHEKSNCVRTLADFYSLLLIIWFLIILFLSVWENENTGK